MSNQQRDINRSQFIDENDWGDAIVEALPGDASFRHYFRLVRGDDKVLLMDAPPETENTRAYVSITRHLLSLGLSSPQIEALDETQGFAIIEDFGNDTFTRLLKDGRNPESLYEMAVDVLVHLHQQEQTTNIDLPPYDEKKLLEEASLLPDWYLPAITGKATSLGARQSYLEAWQNVIQAMPHTDKTVVLRDYHVDNLMVLKGRENASRCGLLDFQDALLGSPAYDLVSLLEDARLDVSQQLTNTMRDRYFTAMKLDDRASFNSWYTMLGVQRHAKVAGIFVRLYVRDGKPVYLEHIPRVMRLLTRNLSDPVLAPVKNWFDEYLPNPEQPLPEFDPAKIRKLIIS